MPTLREEEEQLRGEITEKTSPTAFAEILRNALKSRFGGRQEGLEAGREKTRTQLGTARQTLTAGLSEEELRNITPAQQRELVQTRRGGLESSLLRSQEESQRISGTVSESVELGRQMQRDIQENLLTRLSFLQDDIANQKAKQTEFRQLAFGLAGTGVTVTPEIDEMLKKLSEDERTIWLSQNARAAKDREEDLARASRGGGTATERAVAEERDYIVENANLVDEQAIDTFTRMDVDFQEWFVRERGIPFFQGGSSPEGKYTVTDLNNEFREWSKQFEEPVEPDEDEITAEAQQDFWDTLAANTEMTRQQAYEAFPEIKQTWINNVIPK